MVPAEPKSSAHVTSVTTTRASQARALRLTATSSAEQCARVLPRPLLDRARRTTGDALDCVGDDRRMALSRVSIQLGEGRRQPLRLTTAERPGLELFIGEIHVPDRNGQNS